jgi:hypothetical protein
VQKQNKKKDIYDDITIPYRLGKKIRYFLKDISYMNTRTFIINFHSHNYSDDKKKYTFFASYKGHN